MDAAFDYSLLRHYAIIDDAFFMPSCRSCLMSLYLLCCHTIAAAPFSLPYATIFRFLLLCLATLLFSLLRHAYALSIEPSATIITLYAAALLLRAAMLLFLSAYVVVAVVNVFIVTLRRCAPLHGIRHVDVIDRRFFATFLSCLLPFSDYAARLYYAYA